MSLQTQQWRRISRVAVGGTGGIVDTLSAINTAFSATTYADGSARTPGSGSAWTATAVTNGVSLAPPSGGGAVTQRVLFAGSTGAATPTMASPDTYATSTLLLGTAKNVGAFNAWDAALPYTSGQWFGYWRVCGFGTAASWVYAFEGRESVLVLVENSAGGIFYSIGGAIGDPESTNSLDAESDGRLIGQGVSGTAVVQTDNWTRTSGSGARTFFWNNAPAATPHFGFFVPGSASIEVAFTPYPEGEFTPATTTWVLRSGNVSGAPIYALAGGSGAFRARIREILLCRDGKIITTVSDVGTVKMQIVSGSFASDADAIGLLTQ